MFIMLLLPILGVILLLFYIFNAIMRSYLKVEKPKMFSYNHVNEKHKKIDFTIRTIFAITLLTFAIYLAKRPKKFENIYSEVLLILLASNLVITEGVRAFMEWKYAKNPKAYIFTLSQLSFALLLFWIIFSSSFFNLL